MYRFNWDITFAGYSVINSYLIRKYLHSGPSYVRHGALALKKWGKASGAIRPASFLTSYSVTILWIYYLLVTHQVQWIDVNAIPHAADLPRYPDYAHLSDADPIQLSTALFGFFHFYAHVFDFQSEVASLNRPRRSTRHDVGWRFQEKNNHQYRMCIEDPYEVPDVGLNLGRHMNQERVEILKREFESALRSLTVPMESTDGVLKGIPRVH
jgi:DNA polymerase sigma